VARCVPKELRSVLLRDQACLAKLRRIWNVKGFIKKLFRKGGWEDAGQGWESWRTRSRCLAGAGRGGWRCC